MNRIIINNKSELSDIDSLSMVKIIIDSGRISNNNTQFCHLTTFSRGKKKYQVTSGLGKNSDIFTIIKLSKS